MGCTITVRTTRRVAPANLRPEERGNPGEPLLGGVTTHGQQILMFDGPPRVTPDTVYASVGGVEHRIPRNLIQRMWVRRPGERPVAVNTSDPDRAIAFGSRHIVGAVTKSGEVVEFDRAAPAMAPGDTLFATARGAPYRVPLADLRWIKVRRPSAPLSLLASTGVVVGVTAAIVGLAVRVYHNCDRSSVWCN